MASGLQYTLCGFCRCLCQKICASLLYFVVRVGCRRKTVHVRYLLSWWASCYFCDYFLNCKPIQIIFVRNVAEKIWNTLTYGNFDVYLLCIVNLRSTRNSSGDEIGNVNFLNDDIVYVLQNTIDSCINSATDRRGYVLERMFTNFSEITQYNGHYAVYGHSRSPILVPIESSYTTSYKWLILTYLLSCTVSKLWLIIRQIFASERKCLTLSLLLGMIPCQYRHK